MHDNDLKKIKLAHKAEFRFELLKWLWQIANLTNRTLNYNYFVQLDAREVYLQT